MWLAPFATFKIETVLVVEKDDQLASTLFKLALVFTALLTLGSYVVIGIFAYVNFILNGQFLNWEWLFLQILVCVN